MFTKLMVPLDRSSLAEEALGQAAAIARASHAEIDLLMVHEPVPFAGFEDAPWSTDQFADDEKYLAAVARELSIGATVPVSHALIRGLPADGICAHAREIGADLVVMTSHGRTGMSRAWIGSVADGVVRHSGIPVLLLRPVEGKTDRKAAHHLFTRMLVPIDGSATALEILPAASALARSSGARMMLVRVIQPVPLVAVDVEMGMAYSAYTPDFAATQQLVDSATERLADIVRVLADQGETNVEAHVTVAAHVARGLLDFARGHQVDVIAMTTHGRGATRLLMGSIADKLLRASGLPVMLQHPVAVAASVDTKAAPSVESLQPAIAPA